MSDKNLVDQLTGLELTRRTKNDDGCHIVEAMVQTNELLIDLPMIQANDGTKNNTVVRTSQPTGTKRKYNEGVGSKASTTKTIEDRIVMLEDFSVTDRDLADHSGRKNEILESEDIAFLNGMGETMAEDIIYGDYGADESSLNGFFTRLNTLNNKNVKSAGGTGNSLSSIYVVACGSSFAHLIYPKGRTDCGIKRDDQGAVNWPKPILINGVIVPQVLPAYVRFFSVHYGIAIAHPDAVKRICNIAVGTTADSLIDLILEMIWKLPKGNRNVAIYGNEDVLIKIDKASRDKNNVVQSREDPWGRMITHVREGRCRTVNAITFAESAVTAV